MHPRRPARSKIAALLASAAVGGVVFNNCQTRIKEAAVAGTESYLLEVLLDPVNLVDVLFGSDSQDTTDTP